jgi:DNA-binding CsgD family transcriptional regulator
MTSMTTSDWRKVSDLVHDFHGGETDMPSAVLAEAGALVGCDVASYSSVDHVHSRLLSSVTVPHTSNYYGVASFHQVFAQHPGFVAYRSGRLPAGQPAAWSDLMDRRALRRLPLFVDFFAKRDTLDQLLCVVRLDRRQGGVLAFNRSRTGFTRRERDIVETLSAHLAVAVRHRGQVARLTTDLRRAGHDTTRRDQAAVRLHTLTPREREVAARLTAGLGDQEIARELGVSVRTVHKHLEHVYRKLQLDTRGKVAAVVRDLD